jgi:hypothetical protein
LVVSIEWWSWKPKVDWEKRNMKQV